MAPELTHENKEKPLPKVGVGVGVMLLRSGKVLLGLRHSDAQKADSALHGEGTWTMPGGKLHFHEFLEERAANEVKEETGIEVKDLKLISITQEMVEDAHFITIGFLCEDFGGEAQVMEPDEITEWKWFGLDELPKNMYKPSRKVIENYLAGKIYRKDL
ncbi:MAG: NUDIX domain-containing protein [Candidatus Diapherotrites archaeon]|nr:NUDIX domain-containing protein [Candidatus Diapherotrites archaeon]